MKTAADLLPELAEWNYGRGISPVDWVFGEARSDLATAFADLFWPTFIEFEGHVFREGFSTRLVREWQALGKGRKSVEAPTNVLDTGGLVVPPGVEWSELLEARAIYIGRVLSETYRAKLSLDFPSRKFVVEFFDGSQLNDDDIYLTFWQE